jgi:hypothetical protein
MDVWIVVSCKSIWMVFSVFGWMFGWMLECLDGCWCVWMDVGVFGWMDLRHKIKLGKFP